MKINNIIITHQDRKNNVLIETDHIPNSELGMVFIPETKDEKIRYFSVIEITKEKDTLEQIGHYWLLRNKTLEEVSDILSDVVLRQATPEESRLAHDENNYC